MEVQQSNVCLSVHIVCECSRKFENTMSCHNCHSAGPPLQSLTPQAISDAERVIREYRRVEVNKMAAVVNVSISSDNRIVHGVLQLHETPARWTPNQLALELKKRRVLHFYNFIFCCS